MGILDGLLGGGGGGSPLDLYGDLFTPEQKAALQQRELSQGLFRMAEKLGQAAQPSRVPVNTLGALGSALGAFGTGSDMTEQALKGMQIAEEVRGLKSQRELLSKLDPLSLGLLERQLGVPPGTYGGPKGGLPAGFQPPGAPSAAGAPTAPGAPTGSPPASYAPPPPPIGATPTPAPLGGAPGAESTPDLMSPVTSFPGFEPLPGGGFRALPYGPSDTPGKQSGLLPPPPGAPPGAGTLSASLYGGSPNGAGPFDLAGLGADGDNPDLSNIRIVPLSGEAAPVARPAPGDRSDAAWEYYKPIIKKYESGNRNIEQQVVGPQGGYNPSVGRVTGPSSAGGYLQMIDPTWRAAAQKAGIDTTQFPRAINAPEGVQDEAGKALFKEQGLAPWAPYNARLAQAVGWTGPTGGGGGQDTVIPSGPRLQRGDLLNVADTGGGPLATPSGAGAAPSGVIPGLGITPEALATLNGLMARAGIKNSPFSSVLETYYKSPAYLMEAEFAKALGGLPVEGPKAAAIAAAQQQFIQQNAAHQSDLDIAKELLTKGGLVRMPDGSYKQITSIQEGLAAVDNAKEKFKSENEQVTATITLPGEARPREMPMTRAQFSTVAKGLAVPELGIPAMSGAKLGKPVYNPTELALGPAEAKDLFEKQTAANDAAISVNFNRSARDLLDRGVITGAGADYKTFIAKVGNALGVTGKDTQEHVANTEAYFATIGQNVGKMVQMFGRGTGISEGDRRFAEQMAGGKQTLDEASIRKILDINDRMAMDVINRHNQRVSTIAPGATMTSLTVPVPEPYQPKAPVTSTTSSSPIPGGATATIPRPMGYNPTTQHYIEQRPDGRWYDTITGDPVK